MSQFSRFSIPTSSYFPKFFSPCSLWYFYIKISCIFVFFISFISLYEPGIFWFLNLFSHFQVYYVFFLLGAGIVLFFKRSYVLATLCLTWIIHVCVLWVLPLTFFGSNPEEHKSSVDIYFLNMLVLNNNFGPFGEEIKTLNPDIIGLVEANNQADIILKKTYGKPRISHSDGVYSCRIFSKTPPLSGKVLTYTQYPICFAEFENFRLFVVHPRPPFSYALFEAQKKYFQEISFLLNKSKKPFVLVGDFNSTIFSFPFRQYFGPYFQEHVFSWFGKGSFAQLLTLPIDHALANIPLQITKGKLKTSDHVSLWINIGEKKK